MVRIISRTDLAFKDRLQAGQLLAQELKRYSFDEKTVVLGVPRGGMVVAAQIARFLGGEADIVLSRKIGAPGNPELAIGAVSENAEIFLNNCLVSATGTDKLYISSEIKRQLSQIKKYKAYFRKSKPKIPLGKRTVIITDDGLATGATMQAAALAVRKENPYKIVIAVPVGSEEAARSLSVYCNELFILRAPQFLGAIGDFYENFRPVEDKEVLSLLNENSQEEPRDKGG